eukprot:GHRQ01029620.1.p1 GENE.GHRQ01029620.1~~GHRQ01029620.1.p1  ORF type:complete len:126 (-),score=41.19 GHRQ01029620.1:501-878(-)
MLFAGTAVASGSGIGVVTSIGMCTEIGKIQSQIHAASQEEEDTPLKQKLDQFGELLAKVRHETHSVCSSKQQQKISSNHRRRSHRRRSLCVQEQGLGHARQPSRLQCIAAARWSSGWLFAGLLQP